MLFIYILRLLCFLVANLINFVLLISLSSFRIVISLKIYLVRFYLHQEFAV